MNPFFLIFICLPAIEIYFMIKVGAELGALNTIGLVFLTAIIGIYYAKYEGLNTIKSAFIQINKNQAPAYEIISGAAIALGAVMLIIPGVATDFFGFLIIFPPTRKIIFKLFSNKNKNGDIKSKDYIEGEYKDLDE